MSAGSRIGPYEVAAQIGAGGMGIVYRARDTRLSRDVALKILPDGFAADPDRLARFQREAQILASLNHPNIAGIHGLEEADGVKALVLELVEGPTLADRIAEGPIPVDEALPIARQIAEALEAAHEAGVIHRDLKPANIKLRPDGTVKVLDFGLAKALEPPAGAGDVSQSPTVTTPVTRAGVILGTAAYMSPEQARGRPVDKRADIWAFGAVLFEMLSGRTAFAGDTLWDTIAAILDREPLWDRLSATPPAVRRLLHRCLEKDLKRRLQHMGDVRIEIEDTLVSFPTGTAPNAGGPVEAVGTRARLVRAAAGAIAIAVSAGLAGWFFAQRTTSGIPSGTVRLTLPFVESPMSAPFGVRRLAISADGSRVAYAARSRLWIRRLDQKNAVALHVGDQAFGLTPRAAAINPFFSPDGNSVGLFVGGRGLIKVPVDGGVPAVIARTAERPGGATWRADGAIVFATTEGLYLISEDGGDPRLLVKPDRQKKERAYVWPHFLADEESVLFTIVPEDSVERAQIALLDLMTLEIKIVTSGSSARYVSTGHLVYAVGSTLRAIPFNLATRETSGEPVLIPDVDITTVADNGAADFAVSESGTLIFAPFLPPGTPRTVQWVDRQGTRTPLPVEPGGMYPRVSPDGTRVALDANAAGNRDIWILDLQRLTQTQLTDGPTEDMLPVWAPDGRRVFFASDRAGNFDIYSQAADGATGARLEFAKPGFQAPQSFTPDGRLIVYEDFKDTGVLSLAKPDRLEPLLHGEFDEALGMVSPDGNWIAYESNESGNRFEVFLRPFPDVNARREKVSVNGGRYPVWGPKGSDELFFVNLDGGMMAASVKTSPDLELGPLIKLFDWRQPPPGRSGTPYDISPLDGRFIVTEPVAQSPGGPTYVSVVLNWDQELKRLVPTR